MQRPWGRKEHGTFMRWREGPCAQCIWHMGYGGMGCEMGPGHVGLCRSGLEWDLFPKECDLLLGKIFSTTEHQITL